MNIFGKKDEPSAGDVLKEKQLDHLHFVQNKSFLGGGVGFLVGALAGYSPLLGALPGVITRHITKGDKILKPLSKNGRTMGVLIGGSIGAFVGSAITAGIASEERTRELDVYIVRARDIFGCLPNPNRVFAV